MPSTASEARVAIVTGGATGVGAATALALASRRYRIAVNYSRSAREAEETVALCRDAGTDAIAVQGNVAEDEDCRTIIAAAVERFGRVDALVNSAGTTQFVPLNDLDGQNAEDFQKIYAINVIGPYQMARAAAPHMRQGRNGAIVNVSSRAGLVGIPTGSIYSASKHAVSGWTKSAYPSNPTRHCKVGHNASAALLGAWIQLAN